MLYAGECSGQSKKLDDLLKGSTLNKSTSTYTLPVLSLPRIDVTLCYRCRYDQNERTVTPLGGLVSVRNPREVKIIVAGESSETSGGPACGDIDDDEDNK